MESTGRSLMAPANKAYLAFCTLSLRQNPFATSFLGVKIITIFWKMLQLPINCLVPQLVLPLITPLMSLQSPSNTMLPCPISNCFDVLIFSIVLGS